MGKIFKSNLFSNARESILFAAVFYLVNNAHSNRVSDGFTLLAILLLLLNAGVTIVRATDRFKWDKVILVFSICWAFLEIGLQTLNNVFTNLSWLESVLPVLNHIILALTFLVIFIMCVLALTYPILEKRGKWNYAISANEASMNCIDDYLTIVAFLISCVL